MGSLSRTVKQRTCWSSSASSLQPWLPHGPEPLPCCRLSWLSSSDRWPSSASCGHQERRQVGQFPRDQRENGGEHYRCPHCQGRVHHPAERTLRHLLRRGRQVQRLRDELH